MLLAQYILIHSAYVYKIVITLDSTPTTFVAYNWELNQARVGEDWTKVSYDKFIVYQFTSKASYQVMLLDHASASLVQQAAPASTKSG
jgi:hypothetical protein